MLHCLYVFLVYMLFCRRDEYTHNLYVFKKLILLTFSEKTIAAFWSRILT